MKKLILFGASLVMSTMMYAQQVTTTSESLTASKTSGVYTFTLPEEITVKDIDAVKDYYVAYFSTSFDSAKHTVTLKMTSNEEANRRVMHRLFVSLDVKEFNVSGTTMSFGDLMEKYLK